jgi:hypothetical protein
MVFGENPMLDQEIDYETKTIAVANSIENCAGIVLLRRSNVSQLRNICCGSFCRDPTKTAASSSGIAETVNTMVVIAPLLLILHSFQETATPADLRYLIEALVLD